VLFAAQTLVKEGGEKGADARTFEALVDGRVISWQVSLSAIAGVLPSWLSTLGALDAFDRVRRYGVLVGQELLYQDSAESLRRMDPGANFRLSRSLRHAMTSARVITHVPILS